MMAETLQRLLEPSASSHRSKVTSDESYDNQLRDLVSYLKQLLASRDFSLISDSDLDSLDPSLHSLSYLFVLHFRILAAQNQTNQKVPEEVRPGGHLWSKAVLFLRRFDPIQVRYAGQEWRKLVELVGQSAEVVAKPFLAIKPIRDAMLRLDTSGAVLTSTHILFIRICLRGKAYISALPVLDRYICQFPHSSEQTYLKHCKTVLCAKHKFSTAFITEASGFSAKLTYKDHLLYFLYGAMIYMALKRWAKALHFLNIVISSPAVNSVSSIMLEAYKKWILVSLLDTGKLLALPGVVSSHTAKIYRSMTMPYFALADAFERGDYERLEAEARLGQSVWQSDNNTGLVYQVVEAFHVFTVLRLGKTFAALTMTDVAGRHPQGAVNIL